MTKEKWEIERDKQHAKRKIAMKSLTKKQLDAIYETHSALRETLSMLLECQDLYLSDIRKLDLAFYKLKEEFNIEDKD